MGEIAIGRMAQHRGLSLDVRTFGHALVEDHGRARAQAEDLASVYSVVVPAEPSDATQSELRRLKALNGRAFDREFVRFSIQTHAQDIREYRAEAVRRHGRVSRLAEMAVPMLRRHLRMAQALAVATGQRTGTPTQATEAGQPQG
jgi:putative membrane protein